MRRRFLSLAASAIVLVAGVATTADRSAAARFPGPNGKIAFGARVDSTAAPAQFVAVPSMAVARGYATATTLTNGQVLIAGGTSDRQAELFDPVTRTFTPTAGLMTTGRGGAQTATLLPDGKVLIAGGGNASVAIASAELYDPNTGTFSTTGSMTVPRSLHTATLLPNGKVLIVGGWQVNFPTSALASAELYDPSTGTFTATGSMAARRVDQTATLLPNGKVLLAGGYSNTQVALASTELYDPSTGMFSPTGSMSSGRGSHSETLLGDGTVLVAGGFDHFPGSGLASAEIYHPATGAFTSTGNMTALRGDHTATPLNDGNVLVAGGLTYFPCPGPLGETLASAEMYKPNSGSFIATASMGAARGRHAAAALLQNGDAFIAGGIPTSCPGLLSSAEVFENGEPPPPPPPPPPAPPPPPPPPTRPACPPTDVEVGATYRGTHNGGGSVCFTVTPAWTGVISFLITDVPGDTCQFLWWQFRYALPVPIVDRNFNQPNVLTGSFSADRGAQGTIVLTDPSPPTCTTEAVTWTATTDGTPPWLIPPSPPASPPSAPPPPTPPPPSPPPLRPPTQARCVVPNVKRKTVAQARRVLAAKRCALGRVRRVYSAAMERGHIISQSRRPGSRLPRSTRVGIVVSRGRRR